MHESFNPVRISRQLPRDALYHHDPTVQDTASSKPKQALPATPHAHIKASPSSIPPSPCMMAEELHQIQTYVGMISTRIQYLQGHMEHERSDISQVTEMKLELKTAHRALERFQVEKCEGLGDEVGELAGDATRHAWQSYRSMVTLEEKLRGLRRRESSSLLLRKWESDEVKNDRVARDVGGNREGHGVYIPTGARKSAIGAVRSKRRPQKLVGIGRQRREGGRVEVCAISGARPIEQGPGGSIHEIRRDTIFEPCEPLESSPLLSDIAPSVMHDSDFNSCYQPSGLSNSSLPSKNRNSLLTARQDTSRAHSPSTAHCFLEEINREAFPQPRSSVKLRLQHEEATQRLTLDEPDKVRRGSCNGFTVTKMIMCGIEDARFVLPYFHHIKHHEVRALKNWLCEKMYVKRSGGISRMEKVLHCIQLLQTGCRYESLAVLFSRSPRQIKDSCHEVMAGLLRLHCDTVNVDEATDHVVRMYMPLWGLWTQYGATKGKAALYYGFRLSQVAQVLGALNLYIGRWRMQGGFAVDGPMFSWGGVFVIQMAKREGNCSSELRILGVDDDDDDGTSTIRSVAIASRRFEID